MKIHYRNKYKGTMLVAVECVNFSDLIPLIEAPVSQMYKSDMPLHTKNIVMLRSVTYFAKKFYFHKYPSYVSQKFYNCNYWLLS